MVKPLAFKGDKKSKKRKRGTETLDTDTSRPSQENASVSEPSAPNDDSWVTAETTNDIAGPVIIVLPTEPSSCLACDANGQIFSSEIENYVDGDVTTAEPHDVRQVWVANRVAGTESFSFKGHHGRYMTCDRYGIFSAKATAISPEESFLCISVPDNAFAFSIQTQREKFLSISDISSEVRGDAEEINYGTSLYIRMQARFKPRLKASKEEKAREKITRKELEENVGRRLEDVEVKRLKKARKEGNYHEELLNVKVKGKHDKFA